MTVGEIVRPAATPVPALTAPQLLVVPLSYVFVAVEDCQVGLPGVDLS
jgi:hypothetical protein